MALIPRFFKRKKKLDESVATEIKQSYDVNILNQLIDSESMLNRRLAELQNAESVYSNSEVNLSLVTGSVDTQGTRLVDNWRLASTPEISWCIEEILSELLDVDVFVKPGRSYENLDSKTKELIDNEFNRFIELFNFDSEQYKDDLLHYIIEGELAYEAIVSEDNPEFGIIGIRRLYANNFTAVNSPIIANGFVLNVDVNSVFNSIGYQQNTNIPVGGIIGNRTGKIQSRLVLNKATNEYETDDNHVALTFPDVVYICYGKNNTGNVLTPYSLIDRAREPYFQLTVLQQAAVVMRVTRSPERLLFNVDTHGMSDKLAADFIRKFGNALSKRKTVLPDGNISQQYNPSTMLESWVFGKSANSSGTSIQTVASTANYDQMKDIEYFHNRLLNIFKIPYSRITRPEKEIIINSNNLPYDEARFYKFIQSNIQNKFNNALTQLFLYHLKLKNIKINATDIYVEFEPPARYATYLKAEVLRTKVDMYTGFADRDEFNKYLLMRKYLDMPINEIKAHIRLNRKMDELEDADFDMEDRSSRDFDRPANSRGFSAYSSSDDFEGDRADFNDDSGGTDNIDDLPEPDIDVSEEI